MATLLRDQELNQLAESMTVALIMTGRVDLVTIDADARVGEALSSMNVFDQLPVLRNGSVSGIVRKVSLEVLDSAAPLSSHIVMQADIWIPAATPLLHAVSR